MAREQQGSNLEPGVIARVAAGIRYAFTGNAPEWFGPQSPQNVVVPAEQREGVAGRMLDFPVAYNTRLTPRAGEAVGFQQLRNLGDNYDLMRLIIESRKDQIAKLRWGFKPKDKKAKPDDRCKQLQDFFAMPDREHTWDEWVRMLLEDMLVIDAPTIYPRMTRGGDLYALEPVDGATIKRVIDVRGRTPEAPDTAYQQILKGLPAVDYTRDELIYRPRNVRTNKVYGYSPVEQVIMTVNIAMRRQVHQLQYYTEGSTPDMLFGVPDTWQPEQIRSFESWFNGLLSGNTAERARAKFIPSGAAPINTKDKALKDEYDEWLARIVCYAFSVSAQPFCKEVNKATAETARKQALAEGMAPVQNWVKNLVDLIVIKYFRWTDLEFYWEFEDERTPLERAQCDEIYARNKIRTDDEIRADNGWDPLTPEQRDQMNPPAPDPFAGFGGMDFTPHDPADDKSAQGKEAVQKRLGKFIAPEDKPRVAKAIKGLRATIDAFFKAQAPVVAQQLAGALDLAKADTPGQEARITDKAKRALQQLNLDDWATELHGDLTDYLAGVAVAGGNESLKALGITDEAVTDKMRERATEWAGDRAAEMVGMKRTADGDLVPNPDAKWQITEGTRERLRGLTETALDEGWSAQKFSDEIEGSDAFSEARADMIARTELARADIEGARTGWAESGLVSGREWLTAPDCCDECQDMNGKIAPVDGDFDGDDVPLHPNCRCNTLPVLIKDNED